VGSPNFMRLSLKERRTSGLVRGCVQEIRGISLVFREMWDTTALTSSFRTLIGPKLSRFVGESSELFSALNRRQVSA
jgi:hypothetical protein